MGANLVRIHYAHQRERHDRDQSSNSHRPSQSSNRHIQIEVFFKQRVIYGNLQGAGHPVDRHDDHDVGDLRFL